MSFDNTFDLTAGGYFDFYSEYNISSLLSGVFMIGGGAATLCIVDATLERGHARLILSNPLENRMKMNKKRGKNVRKRTGMCYKSALFAKKRIPNNVLNNSSGMLFIVMQNRILNKL